jgi:hypothetical protein
VLDVECMGGGNGLMAHGVLHVQRVAVAQVVTEDGAAHFADRCPVCQVGDDARADALFDGDVGHAGQHVQGGDKGREQAWHRPALFGRLGVEVQW